MISNSSHRSWYAAFENREGCGSLSWGWTKKVARSRQTFELSPVSLDRDASRVCRDDPRLAPKCGARTWGTVAGQVGLEREARASRPLASVASSRGGGVPRQIPFGFASGRGPRRRWQRRSALRDDDFQKKES